MSRKTAWRNAPIILNRQVQEEIFEFSELSEDVKNALITSEKALENYKNTAAYKNAQFKNDCEKYLAEQAPYMVCVPFKVSAEEQTAIFRFVPLEKNTYVVNDCGHLVGHVFLRVFRCGNLFRAYEITNFYNDEYPNTLGERLHEIQFSGYWNFEKRIRKNS